MASTIMNLARLARAGVVLAQHGVEFVPKGMKVPLVLRLARLLTLPVRLVTWPFRIGRPKTKRISDALASLGPSYIKLGQFLATRADVLGPELAGDLSNLQDKLPPFSQHEAKRIVEESLQSSVEEVFLEFGPPVAAASIAQVHKARTLDGDGPPRDVAVKILRPGIERRFKNDLDSYKFAARTIERFHPPSRRLKPVAVVEGLERTTQLEMDFRLEAAAISEMAENIEGDKGFKVPSVDWKRTRRNVLVLDWIDGIAIWDHDALRAAGYDLKKLGLVVLRSFLRHAMRDGFFHADMHQGNLFVDGRGDVVAVDFGIMGRLGHIERRFLAEILYGLITRDYVRAAKVHFIAGYVPEHHSVETFAQAMRAIGEPIQGRTAEEISMADLLGQLFAYTEVFDMEARPELVLLQKSMVIAEGVARSLDPSLNMWTAAEPVARDWIENNLGVKGRIKQAGEGVSIVGQVLSEIPNVLTQAQQTSRDLRDVTKSGVKLDAQTVRQLSRGDARGRIWGNVALWVGALALAVIACAQLGFVGQ